MCMLLLAIVVYCEQQAEEVRSTLNNSAIRIKSSTIRIKTISLVYKAGIISFLCLISEFIYGQRFQELVKQLIIFIYW